MTANPGIDPPPPHLDEDTFLEQVSQSSGDEPVETVLRTDARVIARVTDGIYRQPASALRELVSNAYDADATRVVIRTDRPRFATIRIEDDGIGMTPEVLGHLLHHIGGSAKRTSTGVKLGVTSPDDPMRSHGGRLLIGKIGIGLFSVSQLTQSFQIITKTEGAPFRTVARVVLRTYSEAPPTEDADQPYEAGRVRVWRESASDPAAHGTTIVLDAVRPQTIETLRSKEVWDAVFMHSTAGESVAVKPIKPPKFHVGSVDPKLVGTYRSVDGLKVNLPWSPTDSPREAFENFVAAIWGSLGAGQPNPRIGQLCDYYLNMIWQLALWIPLPYLHLHPFDVPTGGHLAAIQIAGDARTGLGLDKAGTVRELALLGDEVRSPGGFQVVVDDLELRRPIDVARTADTDAAVKDPLLFVGSLREEFAKTAKDVSGGPLALQAYILWTPKVVPSEHQGVLIRVHDATGTLFDESFLRYPVREQRRLSQISCEIFITEGFDGALNIDREAFNFSHPHVVLTTKWLHAALRYVIGEQKRRASQALGERRKKSADSVKSDAERIVLETWDERTNQDGTEPPSVVFTDDEAATSDSNQYLLSRAKVVGPMSGPNLAARRESVESELSDVLRLLAAYQLLDDMVPSDLEDLLKALRELLEVHKRGR